MINGGSANQLSIHGQPIITTEGANNILEYWSVDNVGNEEPHNTITDIKLDKTSPTADSGQDITVNEDAPMNFDGQNSNDNIQITSYKWEFFDNSYRTLSGSNPQYIFSTPGEYTVNLIVTDSALNSAIDSISIIVLDVTEPSAEAGDDNVIHQGDTVTFDGSKSKDNVGILSYTWTFIDGSPQTLFGVNPNHVFHSAGLYEVKLNVSDAQGNFAMDIVLVNAIDITFPLAYAGSDQIVDEDTQVLFDGSASSDNVGITSYVWTFSDGTIQTLNGETTSYVFETPNVYLVTLTVSDAEGHSSNDTVTYTVLDKTAPDIEVKDSVTGLEDDPIRFDTSQSYDNIGIAYYTWVFGDGKVENTSIPSVTHVFVEPKIYSVELVVTDISGNANSTFITVDVQKDTDRDLLADHLDEDDDDDGMPDVWELKYELNPLDPSDATLDGDGDTIINLEEYQKNTDPSAYDFTVYTLAIILVGITIFSLIIIGIYYFRNSRT
jgi:PKD repeat protein